jgi:hypothetical protein
MIYKNIESFIKADLIKEYYLKIFSEQRLQQIENFIEKYMLKNLTVCYPDDKKDISNHIGLHIYGWIENEYNIKTVDNILKGMIVTFQTNDNKISHYFSEKTCKISDLNNKNFSIYIENDIEINNKPNDKSITEILKELKIEKAELENDLINKNITNDKFIKLDNNLNNSSINLKNELDGFKLFQEYIDALEKTSYINIEKYINIQLIENYYQKIFSEKRLNQIENFISINQDNIKDVTGYVITDPNTFETILIGLSVKIIEDLYKEVEYNFTEQGCLIKKQLNDNKGTLIIDVILSKITTRIFGEIKNYCLSFDTINCYLINKEIDQEKLNNKIILN